MRRRTATSLAALAVAALLAVPGANGLDDLTPPVVTFNLAGTKGQNGWYTSNVTVSWSYADPETGIKSSSGCDTATLVADTPGTRLSCTATNQADVSSSVGVTIRIDKTAPTVSQAAADRGPDSGGWYTRPLRVVFGGTDATSGLEGCSVVTYSGPDAGGAAVSGGCRDRAGNFGAPLYFGFNYDATAPNLAGVDIESGSHEVTLRWSQLPAWEVVTIRRSPGERVVYRGAGKSFTDRAVLNGVKYRYEVLASDPAGNSDTESLAAAPRGPLRAPAEQARVTTPPLLQWTKVRKAAFYNVQVFRNGRKILSAWPVRNQLRLSRTWVWNGRRRTLVAAKYRWFVWPAFKRGGKTDYGKALGHSDFVVR
jgi:hypothetical protein